MQIINTTEQISDFAQSAVAAPFLTIDTEFMSEKRYFAQLCLIQLATPDTAVVIDPLTKDINLDALKFLLCECPVPKVFHAGRQDMAIFYELYNDLPKPIFDTQIAAMVCGFGENVSYQRLVAELAGGQIEKSARFTDWSQRPLSDKQLDYALRDVTYLRDIYLNLKEKLAEQERSAWIDEEMAWLTDPKTYQIDPDTVWERIRVRAGKPKMLNILRFLAAWREHKAVAKNLPRTWVLKDEALLDIATHAPATPAQMAALRALPKGFENSQYGKELLVAVKQALLVPPDQWPKVQRPVHNGDVSAAMDLLKVLLKQQCDTHQVAPKLIASMDDLRAFAQSGGQKQTLPFQKGWRRKVFGEQAEMLLGGQLSLSLQGDTVVVSKA